MLHLSKSLYIGFSSQLHSIYYVWWKLASTTCMVHWVWNFQRDIVVDIYIHLHGKQFVSLELRISLKLHVLPINGCHSFTFHIYLLFTICKYNEMTNGGKNYDCTAFVSVWWFKLFQNKIQVQNVTLFLKIVWNEMYTIDHNISALFGPFWSEMLFLLFYRALFGLQSWLHLH